MVAGYNLKGALTVVGSDGSLMGVQMVEGLDSGLTEAQTLAHCDCSVSV